jgi:opacity protein-like surface antigen
MKKLLSLACVTAFYITTAIAQPQSTVQEGEVGITLGMAHYFGDLNNRAAINRPKPAFGIFFRKQFGDYVGVRLGAHFAQVGYSDIYSDNEFQRRRNLSFNSNIWELGLQGDFNFFRFVPGNPEYIFTPYVTLGVGLFNYDPYAYLNGTKYFLRPLGTEGQNNSTLYPDRKPYSNMGFCFPIGMGIKYNVANNINVAFEISYRFTNTDYLDDVSTTYAGANAFPDLPGGTPSPAFLLQDRSYETGAPIGTEAGRQRGFSGQKDHYVFAEIAVSFSLTSYRCPKPKL